MTKLELAKYAANIVVGAGTTKIVKDVIKNNTTPAETVTDTVAVTASALVISAMAVEATKSYTGAKIDAVADWWHTNVKKSN